MKWLVKIASVFVVIAIYCLAMGGANESHAHAVYADPCAESCAESNDDYSSQLYTSISQVFQVEDKVENQSVRNVKRSSDGSNMAYSLSGWRFIAEYTRYKPSFANDCIKTRKSDLIFPFHYFW